MSWASADEVMHVQATVPWGPTGELVYNRTYRRHYPDGRWETWPDTVARVVRGNAALVDSGHIEPGEEARLIDLISTFRVLPAGRHLWMTGVPGRQFLFNCHVAGWDMDDPGAHFAFVLDQLMQGGGVGSNYSNRYLNALPSVRSQTAVQIVCSPEHPDAAPLALLLSHEVHHSWEGSIRVEDSREGWVAALRALLDHAWSDRAGSLVFDLSLQRASGRPIRTFGGTSGGPVPLATMLLAVSAIVDGCVGRRLATLDAMAIDHECARAVAAAGVRRSSRMSVKSWRDDDLVEFLTCKRDRKAHWTTNLSVEIDNEMVAEAATPGSRARAILDLIVEGMLDNGEPGIWNRELSSVGERSDLVATNPCGEVALEPWENCNLGHVNLAAFSDDPMAAVEAHRLMARFLLRATFGDVPDARQRAVRDRNRRIGVGHLGFQEWVVRQGIRYSDSHRDPQVCSMLARFRDVARDAARDYAAELGIAEPVKVTAVAPTGTVAKLPGVSEGIQPIYGRYFLRRVRFRDDDPELCALRLAGHDLEPDRLAAGTSVVSIPTKDSLLQRVEAVFGPTAAASSLVESADEVPLDDFFGVQAMYQSYFADNAVSATANLVPGVYGHDDVVVALLRWLPSLKGTTVMVDDTRPQAPYERLTRAEFDALEGPVEIGVTPSPCVGDRCPIDAEVS